MMRPQGGSIWFDGYTGQETIITDDFSHRDYKLSYLLRLLDRYAMTLPIKGGMIANNIIITSNYSPHSLYTGADCLEHRNALFRRINTYKGYISQDIQKTYTNILDIPKDTYNDPIDDTDDDEEDIIITKDTTMHTTKTTLQIHSFNAKETNHKVPEPYRCHICGDTFRNEQYFKNTQ